MADYMNPNPAPMQGTTWCDMFPETCRGHFRGFASPEDFATHYMDILSRVHDVPATPDDYELNLPDGLDENELRSLRNLLYDLGISPQAAQRIIDFERSRIESMMRREAREQQHWAMSLRGRPGWSGTNMTRNIRAAQSALDTFGTPGLRALLSATGYGMHPEVLDFFYALGRRLSESPYVEGEPAPAQQNYRVGPDGIPLLTFPNTKW